MGHLSSEQHIKTCVKPGLKALESKHTALVRPAETRKIKSSVFLDECVPGGRWDYLVEYDGQITCLEVHPANTSEVSTVMAKLNWLQLWLSKSTQLTPKLRSGKKFIWIASGGNNHVLPGSAQARKLASSGIIGPVKILSLP